MRGITLADSKSYYKSYCNQDSIGRRRDIDHWNRMENPEINSHKYAQLIFDKCVKATLGKKDNL